MTNVTIRKPNLKDLPALIVLWHGQYDYHHDIDSTYYVPNSKELDQKFRKYLKKAILKNGPYILLAEVDNEPVGFVTYEKSHVDYFDTKIVEYGDIIELYVRPEYRKQGIGKQLMEEVERFFRDKGIEYLSLGCSTFNKDALDFYENFGFVNRQSLLYKSLQHEKSD